MHTSYPLLLLKKEVIFCRIPLSFSFTASPIIWYGSHFFFYYRISFEGRENVPKGTAVIFASNHRSYLDPVLVAMAAPHPFNFIAKEPLFRNPVFGGFIRLMGAFPTADAKHPDYDMLSEAPNGWRNGGI